MSSIITVYCIAACKTFHRVYIILYLYPNAVCFFQMLDSNIGMHLNVKCL